MWVSRCTDRNVPFQVPIVVSRAVVSALPSPLLFLSLFPQTAVALVELCRGSRVAPRVKDANLLHTAASVASRSSYAMRPGQSGGVASGEAGSGPATCCNATSARHGRVRVVPLVCGGQQHAKAHLRNSVQHCGSSSKAATTQRPSREQQARFSREAPRPGLWPCSGPPLAYVRLGWHP